MILETVDTEVKAYRSLQALDFGPAAAVKSEILTHAEEMSDSWEDRLSTVEDEIAAFQELKDLKADEVSPSLIRELKEAAAREHVADYVSQRDYVLNGIAHHKYIEEIRTKVVPVQNLLIQMEQIIGNECYNAKISTGIMERGACGQEEKVVRFDIPLASSAIKRTKSAGPSPKTSRQKFS